MKKTLTLLFAAAGFAAAETTPITLAWDNNNATWGNVDFGADKTISVAVELNWSNVVNTSALTSIYTIDTNDKDDYYLGIRSQKYIGGTNDCSFYGTLYDGIINHTTLDYGDKLVSYATSILSIENTGLTYCITNSLYLWDENEELITSVSKSDSWNYGFGDYTGISINSNFVVNGNIDVYNNVFKEPEALEGVAKRLLPSAPTPGDGNIPEPTTATLSLLALAGLAARRRR